ncbi:MAG: hypothetical protein EZS28_017808, partial [Streblomastix strix]
MFSNIQQSGLGNGAVINAELRSESSLKINDSSSFTDCISELNGGGIYSIISGSSVELSGSTFVRCSGNNGGGIFIDLDFAIQSQISVQSSTFTSCKALSSTVMDIHKGYGSGIFLTVNNWQSSNNGIDLSGASYTTCTAEQGDKGLFIVMNELRQLCRLGNTAGYYVRSYGYNDNNSDKSLLMGYLGFPTTFESALTDTDLLDKISTLELLWININKQWYISSQSLGKNNIACGIYAYPCQTMIYALTLNPSQYPQSDYNPQANTATLILVQDDSIETNININSNTILGNKVKIQSDGYHPINSYTKQSIQSSSQTSTLFTITDIGHLELLGLKFDNLISTSTQSLISISTNNNNQIPYLSIIDCEFESSYPSTSLSYSIISINGGQLLIQRTSMQTYKLSNGMSLIMIKSDETSTSGEYRNNEIEIVGSMFSNIQQSGLGNGAVINAELRSESSLKINDSSSFTDCVSALNSGAIYSIISGGSVELSGSTFVRCSGINGGGIYSNINSGGTLIIKDSSSFTSCISNQGNGGGIFIDIDSAIQSQISVQSATFDSCLATKQTNTPAIRSGYGSGIFLTVNNWQSSNNGIDLNGASYIDCEAEQGDKGLFIVMNELRQLCRLGNTAGYYVRSYGYNDNNSDKSLLMGYLGFPTTFESALTDTDLLDKISTLELLWININKQWYISSQSLGKNNIACGIYAYPCQTMIYALTLNPSQYPQSDYNPQANTATLILVQDDSIETNININSNTILGNKVKIQSDGYHPINSYTKQSIQSSSQTSTLFTITDIGHLELLGLKFDNLDASAMAPLISISTFDNEQIPYLSIIDCEFESSYPSTSLSHSIISINGGQLLIQRTSIQTYKLSNEMSLIMIKSDETSTQEIFRNNKIEIVRSSFSDIEQSGSGNGAVINAELRSESSLKINDSSSFTNCISELNGGGIYSIISGGSVQLSGVTFAGCNGINGGGIFIDLDSGDILSITDSCQFTNCQSTSGSGGAIYAQLSGSNINIDGSTFDTCSATLPGNGGALSLYQQTANSIIKINNVAFTNCKTLSGSFSTFGWGGGIFIQTSLTASQLTQSNLYLTNIAFSGCQSIVAGHNIHIRSPNTKATGQAIADNVLLTVKNLTDLPNLISNLYTSTSYASEYMGIDESKVNSGNAPQTDHDPLFINNLQREYFNPYIIEKSFGIDNLFCGQNSNPCKRIKYILSLDNSELTGYNKGTDIITINLRSQASQDEDIQINSNTPFGNLVKIQSDGYDPQNTYNKQSILTSLFTQTLFSITDKGKLQLYGLKFDNLISTSTQSLISMSSNINTEIPSLSIIDCEFNQDSTSYPTSSLLHSLISINGGKLTLQTTQISNYKFTNGKSFLMIQSDQTASFGIYLKNQIEVVRSTFSDIEQSGSGNGAVINAELRSESVLSITDQSSFTNCVSALNGGGIYSIISGGSVELSGVIFDQCSGINGGGIYSNINSGGILIIKDLCQFTSCTSNYGNGGGIFIDIDSAIQSQISVKNATFDSCLATKQLNTPDIRSGYGSGIFLTVNNWQSSNNEIDLRGASYTTCTADQGDKGLFIVMNELRQLCRLEGLLGKYVRSYGYTDNNSDKSLLMGYLGFPTTFESALTDTDLLDRISALEYHWKYLDHVWYISNGSPGKNNIACGISDYPCQTITYTLTLNPSLYSENEYNPQVNTATLILVQDDSIETNIIVSSSTILGNKAKIQSNGYIEELTTYTKRSIQSSLKTSTLFTITDIGHLELLGLHFDNLDASAMTSLISISSFDNNQIPFLSIIDCEFESSYPSTSLSHSIISINGGQLLIQRSTTQSYKLSNEMSLIMIKSDQTSIYGVFRNNQIEIIGSSFSDIEQSGSGNGAVINAELQSGSVLSITDSNSFINCQSTSGSGGAIYAQLSGSNINIDGSTFDRCSATQPGNGGALSIYQQTANSIIKINNVAFTNCKTLSGSFSTFGWGGGIFIQTSVTALQLTSSNFYLTNIAFSGCQSIVAGHNIHIRSPNTYNTGIIIAKYSLLTVKNLTDLPNLISNLYTSTSYASEYMGIDESNVNSGSNTPNYHKPLFQAAQGGFIAMHYYIKSTSSDGTVCSSTFPCQTINNILNFEGSQIVGFVKRLSIVIINLLSDTSDQDSINLNSVTKLNNIVTLQSDGYHPINSYTKRQIQSSSKTSTLFTITDIGHLELLGLKSDNLISTSTQSLFSISTNNNEQIPYLSIIDCEFESSYPSTSLSHSIISINGGQLLIQRTSLQTYKLSNGMSLIMIKSDQTSTSGEYRNNGIEIVECTFSDIEQSGSGNGAVINAELRSESVLRITDSSSFINCQSTSGSGGAIYAQLSGSKINIDGSTFDTCSATQPGNGGALSLYQQTANSVISITNSLFKDCKTLPNS